MTFINIFIYKTTLKKFNQKFISIFVKYYINIWLENK